MPNYDLVPFTLWPAIPRVGGEAVRARIRHLQTARVEALRGEIGAMTKIRPNRVAPERLFDGVIIAAIRLYNNDIATSHRPRPRPAKRQATAEGPSEARHLPELSMGVAHDRGAIEAASVAADVLSLQKDPKLFCGSDDKVHSEEGCSSETQILYGLNINHGDFSEIFTPLCDTRS